MLGPYDPDQPLATQFRTPVHCVRVSRDGLVYVCDRNNNRIQVFQRDGSFVTEFRVEPRSAGCSDRSSTSASPRMRSRHTCTWPMAPTARSTSSCAAPAKCSAISAMAAGRPGQFHWLHTMAVDSQGNIYTGEVDTGKRIQKFRRVR